MSATFCLFKRIVIISCLGLVPPFATHAETILFTNSSTISAVLAIRSLPSRFNYLQKYKLALSS